MTTTVFDDDATGFADEKKLRSDEEGLEAGVVSMVEDNNLDSFRWLCPNTTLQTREQFLLTIFMSCIVSDCYQLRYF